MTRKTTNHDTGRAFATRAIHVGYDPASEQGALNPPVYMTSTYTFETVEDGAAIFAGEKTGYTYGRNRNPTQSILETRIADLEGGEAGLAFASGMAAITATFLSLVSAGDLVVADTTLYGNTFAFFTKGLTRFGVEVVIVDLSDATAREAALARRPKVVFFETPANPTLRIVDIAEIAAAARRVGALTIVDNTFATPALQRPIELGVDLVVHSATKFIGGHGDLIAGLLVGPADLVKQVRLNGLRCLTGATIAPLTAFLLLRGLKTLDLRVERHSASAQRIAETLQAHPAIAHIHYPGLAEDPGHAIARRQMSAFGGLVAFELAGGLEAGRRFMNRLVLAHRAVSLGDAETLVQHPATMTHAVYPPEERRRHGISDGLVRLSVGLEAVADILADIEQALEATL